MPVTMVDREGNEVHIEDPGEARARWQAGELGFAGNQRVSVIDRRTGEIGTIDATPEELERSFAGGLDLARPEEFEEARRAREYGDAPVRSFLEAVPRGVGNVIPGIGQAADDLQADIAGFTAGEGQNFSEARDRARLGIEERAGRNPLASGAGELAGTIAGAAAIPMGGVESMAGRVVARGLGEEIAGGVVSRALRAGAQSAVEGTIEGAGMGAVQVMGEEAMNGGDHDLTAEQIAATMGLNALIGGGAGGVFGVGSRLARDGGERVARELVPQIQRALSDRSIRNFAEQSAFKASGAMLRDFRLAERRAGGAARIGRDLLDEGVVTMDATLDDIAERAAARTEHHGQRVGEMVRQLDEAGTGVLPNIERIESRIQRDVIAPLERSTFHSGIRDQVEGIIQPFIKRFSKQVDAAGNAIEPPPLTFSELHTQRQALDDIIHRNQGPNPPQWIEEARKARTIIEEELETAGEEAAQRMGGNFRAEYQEAKRLYGSMVTTRKIAQDRLLRDQANRFFSPSDYGVGSIATLAQGALNPGSLAMGFVTGALHKVVRERGRAFVASGLDRVSRIGVLAKRAESGAKRVEGAVDGLLTRTARRTAQAARAARTPAVLSAFEDRVKEVREAQTQPEANAAKLVRATQRFADAAPRTATAIAQTHARAQQFLASKLPPHRGDALMQGRGRSRVSDMEARRFLAYARAVDNPGEVLDDISDGRVTREGVETLREVYPKLYAQVQEGVMRRLTETDEPPSYETRLRIGMLLGVPSDPALEPRRLASLQSMYAEAATQGQQTGAPSGQSTAPSQPDAALMSSTEALEARRSMRA